MPQIVETVETLANGRQFLCHSKTTDVSVLVSNAAICQQYPACPMPHGCDNENRLNKLLKKLQLIE